MARVREVARIADILAYLDGPQLMLMEMPDHGKLVAVAITIPRKEYPFFAAKISDDQWNRYMREFLDLRYLFMFPSYKKWYIFDLDPEVKGAEGEYDLRVHPVQKNEVLDSYIPSSGFFSRHHTEGDGHLVKEGTIQRFGIDGSWGAGDFSRFNAQLDDIYSLLAALNDFSDRTVARPLKRGIADAFLDYPFRGGASYVHFYDDLERIHPFEDRLTLDRIQYLSPGYVDVRGRAEILAELKHSIQSYSEVRSVVREKYLQLQRYLRKAGLLRESAKRFEAGSSLGPRILKQARDLAEAVNFRHLDLVYQLTDSNELASAKVMLSFVRRLEKAFMFFAEGRARFDG
jgi:hypothetical protein